MHMLIGPFIVPRRDKSSEDIKYRFSLECVVQEMSRARSEIDSRRHIITVHCDTDDVSAHRRDILLVEKQYPSQFCFFSCFNACCLRLPYIFNFLSTWHLLQSNTEAHWSYFLVRDLSAEFYRCV